MKTRLLIAMAILTILSACSPTIAETNNDNGNECIQPLYDVAFPVVSPEHANNVTPRQIPPQGNWQDYDTLPFEGRLMAIRPEKRELWFSVQNEKVYRYFIDTKQWKSHEWNARFYPIFMANDGTVWSLGKVISDKSHPKEFQPVLERFDDKTGHFEYAKDVTGFLQESPQWQWFSDIAEDQSGLIWFFTGTDRATLVSLDVRTGESHQHYTFTTVGINSNISIASDGSVWFRNFQDKEIIQYIPSTQDTRTYKIDPAGTTSAKLLTEFDKANYIFTDRSGRLWIANYAWLDFSNAKSPEWHQIIESPVFITDRGLPDSQYIMAYQLSTYQSSNGWYWFTGGNGIVRLDLEKGSWCLMTTGISEVVEDNDHNLWIAVFGHLYKYNLNP